MTNVDPAGSALDRMPALLPLAGFVLLLVHLHRRRGDWRESWIVAATLWGTLVTGFTETLSLFHGLTAPALAALWLLAGAALAAGLRRRPATAAGAPCVESSRWEVRLMVGLLAVWLAGLGLVAVTAAPNNFDAMTYHLPRVMHWIQDRGVGFYPTSIQRQLYLGPWAEYAILQFQLLLGADWFANAVQWFALVTAIVGVSLIARELGASARGQWLAAVLTATMPMAVLQSTSPQTDLTAACWLVSAVVLMLLALKSPERGRWLVVLAGLALGQGILTKATIYCFGFAPCLWLAWGLVRRDRVRAVLPLAAFAAAVLAVNLPCYIREIRLYHSPFGPAEDPAEGSLPAAPYANARFTPAVVLSNTLRNAALELASPSRWLTGVEQTATRRALHALGIDPDDQRTTWTGDVFALSPNVWANENYASDPLQFLLLLAAGVAVLFFQRRPRGAGTRVYLLLLLGGWILFCLVLRWTIWNTRLLLPLLVLGMPLVGLMLDRLRPAWPVAAVAALVFGAAVLVAVRNPSHPLAGSHPYYRLDRIAQYYLTSGPQLERIHREITRQVVDLGATRIGLRLGRDDWEYPLWVRLQAAGLHPRIEHVDVHNRSARYAATLPPFAPQVTITIQLARHRVEVTPVEPRPAPPPVAAKPPLTRGSRAGA